MSTLEAAEIESALTELEQRILARIGRWALTIIGTCVVLAVGAATQWFGVIGRIDRLEVWKAERAVGVEEYQEFREDIAARMARLEAGQSEILRLLQSRGGR